MIQGLRAALRFEALSLGRTRETWTLGVLPAALCLPLALASAIGIASFSAHPRVAVPVGLGLDLDGIEEVAVTDPVAAFEGRRADAAIVSYVRAPDGGLAVEARWRAEGVRRRLEAAVRQLSDAELDARVIAAGGSVARDRVVGSLAPPAPRADVAGTAAEQARLALGVWLGAAAYLGCFLVPGRTTSERLGGVLELFAVTRTQPATVFLARAVAATLLCGAIAGLPALSFVAIFGTAALPRPSAAMLVEAGVVLFFANAFFVACGVWATSTRVALSTSSLGMLVLMGAGLGAFLVEAPAGPLVGFGLAEGAVGRIAACAVAAGVALGFAAFGALRDGGALPPAGGDA